MSTDNRKLTITLATRNEGKRRELTHWVARHGLPVELLINEAAPDVAETGLDFIENALLKARNTPPVSPDRWVLAEDSGLVVDALDGQYGISPFPGLYSNRWLTPAIRDELLGRSYPNRLPLDRTTETDVTNSDLCQGILKLMEGKANRSARYCCGMVLWHPERGLIFQTLESTELQIIAKEPRGTHGFGYDPVTIPVDDTRTGDTQARDMRTMAELSPEEKNRISHRGKAFGKLLDFLERERLLPGS